MKKNAFTLIELIAVIVILGLIALIVFPAVNSVIKNSKEKAYNQQIAAIKKAAKECSYENTFILPETTTNGAHTTFPLTCLTKGCDYNGKHIDGGYLEYEEDGDPNTSLIKNPKNTEKYLNGNITITYYNGEGTTNYKGYTYEYND